MLLGKGPGKKGKPAGAANRPLSQLESQKSQATQQTPLSSQTGTQPTDAHGPSQSDNLSITGLSFDLSQDTVGASQDYDFTPSQEQNFRFDNEK